MENKENANPTLEIYACKTSEMLLIGNIMNNLGLLNEYGDTLSSDDFTDLLCRYLFQVIKRCHALYGDVEVTDTYFSSAVLNLADEFGIKFPSMSGKKIVETAFTIKGVGSLQPADSEAYRAVKRYTMLRQLDKAGVDVWNIKEHPDFSQLTADQIVSLVYEKIDPLANAVSLHPHEDFGSNIKERALRFFEKPEIGLQTPFSFLNDHLHGLCPNDFTLIGGLSNTGKGRFLMNLLVWLVAMEGQTVCLLSNEMTGEDFFKAMVCTIINNPDLHGKDLRIPQGNIVQSHFRGEDGQYIERLPEEPWEEFHSRVIENSAECREYEAILQWWEETYPGRFIFVNVANDYSNTRLKQEIRRAKAKGCTVIAYDTLKSYQSTEWGELVQATTELSEAIKSDKDGLVGLATFQLTDDVATCKPEELSNLKIARAKGMMHLADNVLMFMPLRDQIKGDYMVVSETEMDDFEEPLIEIIEEEISVAAFRIVKNRRGGGKEKMYAVQTNLDTNRWIYIGELVNEAAVKQGWAHQYAG